MAFQPITAEELLEVLRRSFPKGYLVPIEEDADGQGWDLYTQMAAQFAEVARAANVTCQAYYIRPHSTQTAPEAAGPTRATTTVQISRAAPATGAVELVAGTRLRTEVVNSVGVTIEGPEFELVDTVTIAAGSLGPMSAAVQAVRPGYQGNVRAGTIVGFSERGTATLATVTVEAGNVLRDTGTGDVFTPAMAGQFIRLIGGANGGTYPRRILSVTPGTTNVAVVDGAALITPDTVAVEVEEFADIGLTVNQPNAATGGTAGFLDAIGAERLVNRQAGELDDEYRDRVAELPDTVSPAAIDRIAARILSPLGIGYEVMETGVVGGLLGFVLDDSAFDWAGISDGLVLLDAGCGQVRFFIIRVGLGDQGEFGAPFDTPFAPDNNALDVLAADGYPALYYVALGGLYDAVERARLGGVCWELVLDTTL